MKVVSIPEALNNRIRGPDDAPDCAWLLEHGQTWETGRDPDSGVERMIMVRRGERMRFPRGRCFNNVRRLVEAEPWFTYVEGVAQKTPTTAEWHAWAVTPSGTVVDPTWHPEGPPPKGQKYYGATFTRDALTAHPKAFDTHDGMVAATVGGRVGSTLSLLVLTSGEQQEIAGEFRRKGEEDT